MLIRIVTLIYDFINADMENLNCVDEDNDTVQPNEDRRNVLPCDKSSKKIQEVKTLMVSISVYYTAKEKIKLISIFLEIVKADLHI